TGGNTRTGNVTISASNTQSITSGAAGVAVGGGGAGLAIVVVTPTTVAAVGSSGTVTASGAVVVQAPSPQSLDSIGAGLAVLNGAGGAMTVYVLTGTTTAEIADATVTAGGNVAVLANSTDDGDVAVGGGALGLAAGLGASLGVSVISTTTEAK